MRASCGVVVLFVLLAGCTSPEASHSAGGVGSEEPISAANEVVVEYRGFIVARPGSSAHAIWTGDAPQFGLNLSENVTLLRLRLTWDTPQEMGLEVIMPDESRVNSWGDGSVHLQPPIELEVPVSQVGTWGVVLGPSSVGGAVNWHLVVTMTTTDGATRPSEAS